MTLDSLASWPVVLPPGQPLAQRRRRSLAQRVLAAPTAALVQGPAIALGAIGALVNAGMQHVHPAFAHGGELFPIKQHDALRGAQLVRRLLGTAPAHPDPSRFDALRMQRPLLATLRADVAANGTPLQVHFAAQAAGDDYARRGGETSPIAVYVDGRYHSDVLVLAERDDDYTVNLADVAPGPHQVELRYARDEAGPSARQPTVGAVDTRATTGIGALVARYAPILETRWSPAQQLGARPEQTYDDAPMAMVAVLQPQAGGMRRLRYYLMSTNEDTSGYPFGTIMRKFGRTTDYELMYEAYLRPDGSLAHDDFQGPVHLRWQFVGERRGERPVLRVDTRNGQFTSNAWGVTPRWSETPVGLYDHMPDDREVMLHHPWMFAAMGKENIREGRAVPVGTQPTSNRVAVDARQHLYFEARDGARKALERQRALTVVLRDGRRVTFKVAHDDRLPTPRGLPPRTTAVPLPAGLRSNDIVAVEVPDGQVFTLDDAFRPRFLAVGAAAAFARRRRIAGS